MQPRAITSRSVFSLLLFCRFIISGAQTSFQKTYGGLSNDYAFSVQETTGGGFILAGNTESSGAGGADAYVIRTDAVGNTLWSKTYGGANTDDFVSGSQLSDGTFVFAGYTKSFGAGNEDFYLVKTDAAGNTAWSKTYGGSQPDYISSVVNQNTDGGYMLSGRTSSYGQGSVDYYMVKTDVSGNVNWAKTYGGTNGNQNFTSIQTSDGGFITAGYTSWDFLASGFSDDIYIVKTDASGNVQWTKVYGAFNSDIGIGIQETKEGGFIVVGYTLSFGAGNYDCYLLKLTSIGNISWMKTYGGTNEDYAYNVVQTADSGFCITGFTNSFGSGGYDAYVVKTDKNGNLVWSKAFGGAGTEILYNVRQTSDGGYALSGYTNSVGAGNYDAWLVKTDALGNSGCNQVNAATVVINQSPSANAGGITGAGCTVTSPVSIVNNITPTIFAVCPVLLPIEFISFTVECAEGLIILNWTAVSEKESDQFHVEKSSDGINFSEIAIVNSAGINSSAQNYTWHDFSQNNLSEVYYRITSDEINGKKSSSDTRYAGCAAKENSFRISPNPVNSLLTISGNKFFSGELSLKLLNISGEIILNQQTGAENNHPYFVLDLSSLAPSLYFLCISDKSGFILYREKIIRQ